MAKTPPFTTVATAPLTSVDTDLHPPRPTAYLKTAGVEFIPAKSGGVRWGA
jgi:hypothetical protein